MRDRFEKNLHAFRLGDIYLDGAYHPTICLRIDINNERKDIGLEGISLLDGSYPRGCSVMHSAPEKITCEEAWHMKEQYEISRRPANEKSDKPMRYADGQNVMLGDIVKLDEEQGKVEALIDRDQHPSAFGENVWEGYKNRAVIRFSKRGYVHFIVEIDRNINLVSRESAGG